MPWGSVVWVSLALSFTGLALAQGSAPDAADPGDFRQTSLWLMWGLVWVLLAAGLCSALFKLYSQWPGAERPLVAATLVAMPPVSTILTTAHLPLLGWLFPRGGGNDYASIFAFWVVVALCFGAAWRFVKTRSNWLKSPQDKPAVASGLHSSDPDFRATRSVDADSARTQATPSSQEKSVDSEAKAGARANMPDAAGRLDEEPAPSTVRRAPVDPVQARASERKPEPTRAGTDSIFISYRRQDSADVTGRIYDRLIQRFDRKQVFKDVDSIPLGVDFRAHLGDVVGRCNLLLAIIGPQWLNVGGPNGRRLDDAGDFVRIEIEAALARNIPVIPLLVGGAELPSERDLPPSLAAITFRNGIAVRPDPDFHRDMDRLIAGLESHQRG
jgi:hypothetical protein